MRCPKCGYISFDHLETCKKCKKDISKALEDLDGVVFEAASPVFLVFDYEASVEAQEDEYIVDVDEGGDEEVVELSLGDEAIGDDDEIVMDLGGEDNEVKEFALDDDDADNGLSIDFDDFEEIDPDGEITLDLDDEPQEVASAKEEGLPLDFGEIDISDLAPPAEDTEEMVAETLSLDNDPASEVALTSTVPAAPVSAVLGSGLEDLQVEDLDLDVAAPLVAGSKAGDKLMPSVKTGTALDDFEIDLGELINDEK